MAKLNGPLMSIDARGSLGPRLTFSTRSSGPQCRFQSKQADAQSAGQLLQRGFFSTAITWWGMLTPVEKGLWAWEGDNP
jgi:hypothetical protein